MVAVEKVFLVGPPAVLGGAAGADDRERGVVGRWMVVGGVPVAVQPQADAAAVGDADQSVEVAESANSRLAAAAGQPDGIVRHQDAPAAGDPLGERVDRIADALALQPGTEILLKMAGSRGRSGAVVVVAGHGEAGRGTRTAEAEQLGGPRKLLREAHGAGVAREDDAVVAAMAKLVGENAQDVVGPSNAGTAAQQPHGDPGRHPFVEPVLPSPDAGRVGDVNVAEVRQADGGGGSRANGDAP